MKHQKLGKPFRLNNWNTINIQKYKRKNWVEGNACWSWETFSVCGHIDFKTTVLRASFGDYSDAYLLAKVEVTIILKKAYAAARLVSRRNKNIAFLNYALLKFYNKKIIQIDRANSFNNLTPMFIRVW